MKLQASLCWKSRKMLSEPGVAPSSSSPLFGEHNERNSPGIKFLEAPNPPEPQTTAKVPGTAKQRPSSPSVLACSSSSESSCSAFSDLGKFWLVFHYISIILPKSRPTKSSHQLENWGGANRCGEALLLIGDLQLCWARPVLQGRCADCCGTALSLAVKRSAA